MSMTGKVYLVGAGCGAYDLITLRGARLLEECEAVVYDSLIDDRLLELVPKNTEKICVGKRAGQHSETQENINQLLVRKALEGKTVVRLKGGDPFVFGRGGEEILALQEKDIPYSVVPGISSAVAAPELAGIPVTHRRISRSFHVITGHTADDLLPENMQSYARLGGTLVFLMGLRNLRDIADSLISGGMRGATPAAVISCGGTLRQRTVRASLDSIAGAAEREEICAPAVIVVGETAGMELAPAKAAALNGVSVAVTGTERFCEKLSYRLEALGAEVHCRCRLNVVEYENNERFESALRHIDEYSWLAFTSMNGVEIFFEHMRKTGTDTRTLHNVKIAALGKGTAQALEKRGVFPQLVPEKYTAAALGASLVNEASGSGKILILRAEKGSAGLTKPLDEAGLSYDDVKIYDVTASDESIHGEICDDYLVFGSASGVHAFFAGENSVSDNTKIVCIGYSTAEALRSLKKEACLVCEEHSADGIIQAILREEEK